MNPLAKRALILVVRLDDLVTKANERGEKAGDEELAEWDRIFDEARLITAEMENPQ